MSPPLLVKPARFAESSVRAIALISLLLAARSAWGQSDDYVITPELEQKAANMQAGGVIDERNFNSWIFGNIQAAKSQSAPPQLPVLMAELERVCQITPQQRQKLELAARMDHQLFLNDVEAAREQFLKFKTQQEVFNEFYSTVIRPLAMRRTAGLLGPGSLFVKVIPNTLRPDQLAAYEAAQTARKKYQYQTAVNAALLSLGEAVGLSAQEQQQLARYAVENTPPPLIVGRQERQYVYYQLSQIGVAELQKFLPKERAEKLHRLVARYEGMKQSLISIGMLPGP